MIRKDDASSQSRMLARDSDLAQADETAPRRWGLCSLIAEVRAAFQRHTVAVTALAKDTFDPLRRFDQSTDLVQLPIDQLAPVVFCATPTWGGQQATDVGKAHAQAPTESNERKTVDGLRVVAASSAHPHRFWQDAGVLVVADGGGAITGGGRHVPDGK